MKIRLNYVFLISFFTFFVSSCAVIEDLKNYINNETEDYVGGNNVSSLEQNNNNAVEAAKYSAPSPQTCPPA